MIEPPEVTNPVILAEVYEPSAIAKLCRFAFPEHDDQKHALELQAEIEASYHRKLERRRSNGVSTYSNYLDQNDYVLNKLDIYSLGYRSDRHTFTLVLSDGKTKLYGHTLRYLPNHKHSRTRVDVGRRGVRAMVILTRVVGGDKFFTAILRSLVSVMIQAEALSSKIGYEDVARDRAMRVLHNLHKEQVKTFSEAMIKLKKKELDNLGDDYLVITSLEFDIDPRGFIQDRMLPGDYIRMQIPASLQAGFRVGVAPDDIDVPILPLLRCLGAVNTVLILVAVMCERRLVLVSSDASKLSACVRALSSMLAQGLLMWRYSMVPVLPPHLFDFLMDKKPFIVGILDDFLNDIKELENLKEALCVHLDKNQFKTFAKEKPSSLIPDVLLKTGKETVMHILYNDLQQIIKAEARFWGEDDKVEGGIAPPSPPNDTMTKRKKPKGKTLVAETDMPGLFSRVMRNEPLDALDVDYSEQDKTLTVPSEINKNGVSSTKEYTTRHGSNFDQVSISKFDICENERGEEGLRAAITFFFLVTHGDLNSIISRSRDGTFLLDRKKYMLHKKKQGNKERSELFKLYKIFSGSAMLEHHLGQRIEEFNRGRNLLMPRHRSLFSLCEKHLRVKKTEFSYTKIREIVAGTSEHSPLHGHVQKSELARAHALTLTSAEEFDGNVSLSLFSLLKNCHLCDSVLPQTIAVIWERLDDRSQSDWKHPLLGLHLLKNLLLHGPICIISYALDGLDKIQKLRSYDIASKEESNKEVRESAETVWQLVVNSSRLLLQRQQKQAARAKFIDSKIDQRWGSYLLKKVPFSTDFRQYHTILRPRPSHIPAFMNKTGPTNPRDAPFIGKDIEEMAIVRMELAPRGEKGNRKSAPESRLQDSFSSTIPIETGQQQRRPLETTQDKRGSLNGCDASNLSEISTKKDLNSKTRQALNERNQRSLMNSSQRKQQRRTVEPGINTQRKESLNEGQYQNGVGPSSTRKGGVGSIGKQASQSGETVISRQSLGSRKSGRIDPRRSQRREHLNGGHTDVRSATSHNLQSVQVSQKESLDNMLERRASSMSQRGQKMPQQVSSKIGQTQNQTSRQVQHPVENSNNAFNHSRNNRGSFQLDAPLKMNTSSQSKGGQIKNGISKSGNNSVRCNGSYPQKNKQFEDANKSLRSKEGSSRKLKPHPYPNKGSQTLEKPFRRNRNTPRTVKQTENSNKNETSRSRKNFIGSQEVSHIAARKNDVISNGEKPEIGSVFSESGIRAPMNGVPRQETFPRMNKKPPKALVGRNGTRRQNGSKVVSNQNQENQRGSLMVQEKHERTQNSSRRSSM
eukprot:CAMPEP_0194133712 /NCGR_PEP_ID=MMETSP0152-20130528/3765_1 /TAXON_ID=1049557 /ORGANISM="Thalassiothrix antarctica, Strain L6-D1" /LENGTH=1309 /DNA_ID=CAMNT_0038829059 /DNA_START=339 /DNA_END=4268 /DNA_ORIENTATION=-